VGGGTTTVNDSLFFNNDNRVIYAGNGSLHLNNTYLHNTEVYMNGFNADLFVDSVQIDGNWANAHYFAIPSTLSLVVNSDATGANDWSDGVLTHDEAVFISDQRTAGTTDIIEISDIDALINDNTPEITGTAIPGATVELFDGNNVSLGTTIADATTGAWSFTTGELSDGEHSIYAVVSDGDKTYNPTHAETFTVDTTAPAVTPTVTAINTSDNTPVVSGTATLGTNETLTVVINGATYNNITVTAGAWSVDTASAVVYAGSLGAFTDGKYSVTATVTDLAGNATSDITSNEVTIDTTDPTAPTITAAATNDSTPVISGTATLLTGETLSVVINGATYDNVSVSNGTWMLDTAGTHTGTLGTFTDGTTYSVTATVTDAAGNATSDTTSNEITFDTTAPGAPSEPTFTGAVTSGDIISISGSSVAEAGLEIDIVVGGTVVGTATPDETTGEWTYSLDTSSLVTGTVQVTYVARDTAGNETVSGTPVTLQIDPKPQVVVDVPVEVPAASDPVASPTASESPVEAGLEDTIIVQETNINTDVELYTGEQESTVVTMEQVAEQISQTLSVTTPASEVSVTVIAPSFADTFSTFESAPVSDAEPVNADTGSNTQQGHSPVQHSQPMTMELFKQLDSDTSDSLNIEELNERYEGIDFNEFDLDNDGTIDEDEFKKMLDQQNKDKTDSLRTLMDSRHTLETAPKYSTAFQSPIEKALDKLIIFNS